jgi:response regulator RpfG family c-di-GMP phosphodiesterase
MLLYSVEGEAKAIASEEQNFSFWNRILFSGKDLDFPWLTYFLTCLTHRHNHLTKGIHRAPDAEPKETLRKILDNAISINKLYHRNREAFSVHGGTRYDFFLWEAQFLSDLISYDHLLENLEKRKAELAPGDYSADAMYVKFRISLYVMFYAAKMEKLRHRKDEIIDKISKEAKREFSMIPMSVNPESVSNELQAFATNLSEVFKPMEQLEFVLKMSTFRHIPTYAHSIVVGKIAATLTRFLAKAAPEDFIGFMGIEQASDVAGRIEELCEIAHTSGLCHDIGKISYVCNPYMQARLQVEEELGVIKQHPETGALMMAREDGSSLSGVYLDVIKGHHKYYDGSGGYPEDFDIEGSKYRIMIDIITVADTIDSATDDIGDMSIETQSLEAVVSDIRSDAGKRYSPVVADALGDDAVIAEIARILDTERRDAYYTAYCHAWDGSDQE